MRRFIFNRQKDKNEEKHEMKDRKEKEPVDNNLSNQEKFDKFVIHVFWGTAIITFIIVCFGLLTFFNACQNEKDESQTENNLMATEDSIYEAAMEKDSILTNIIPVKDINNKKETKTTSKDTITGNDLSKRQVNNPDVTTYLIPLSEITKIRTIQRQIYKREDQLTDDIRQETNNIINKMNGWLSFWMGIIAIIGVFVPIALQLKLYRENRDNDSRLRSECEKEITKLKEESDYFKKQCETFQRTAQAEIKAELLKMENEQAQQFAKLHSKYSQELDELQPIRFAAIIRSFHNILDSPEIRNVDTRNQLLAENWKEIVKKVRRFTEFYSNDTPGIGKAYIISVILVQVASVITSLKIILSHRNRQLDALASEAYDLIQNLNSHEKSRQEIVVLLNDFQDSLSNLKPFIY